MPDEQKEQLKSELKDLQEHLGESFFKKSSKAFSILFFEMPIYERLWLLLSLIVPIMLLKKVDGAAQLVWLLPLLAAFYAFDNRWHGSSPAPASDYQLFPTEKTLVENYLNEPLSPNIFEQQGQLQKAWKEYLIQVWNKQAPRRSYTVRLTS